MTKSLQANVVALLASVALSGCGGHGQRELYTKAIAAESRHDHDAAITCLNTLLQRDPKNAPAYNALGVAYEEKGDLTNAIFNYDKAVQLRPKDADFRYNLGSALGKRGDISGSLTNLSEAIGLNPMHAKAYANRGSTFVKNHDLQKAIGDYSTAIRLDPGFSETYAARAYAYVAEGEFDKAIDDNNKAIHLDPKNAYAYNSLGWLLATCRAAPIRNGTQAVAAARKACELSDWHNSSFIDTLAAAWAEAGDFGQAIKFQEQAMSMNDFTAEDRAKAQQRLELFRQRKPYHESADP